MRDDVLELFKSLSRDIADLRTGQIGMVTDKNFDRHLEEKIPTEFLYANIAGGSGYIKVNDGGGLTTASLEEVVRESTTQFSGIYWFRGKKYELSGTAKEYWYHDATDNSSNWSDGPMPDEMPDSQFWRVTAACKEYEWIEC